MNNDERIELSPTVTEALRREGVKTNHKNELPKGQRSNKDVFAKVIHALREAESSSNKDIVRLQDENRKLRDRIDDLTERLLVLEAEVRKSRVKETLEAIPALTTEDKTKLLELAV